MPIYEIRHAIPLTTSQKDSLAQQITAIHSQKFTTPKLFVQVYYTDVSSTWSYVGGRRRSENHIRGQVRTGPSRSQEDWNSHIQAIADAWENVVGSAMKNGAAGGGEKFDTTLRSVILTGGMVAGLEAGKKSTIDSSDHHSDTHWPSD